MPVGVEVFFGGLLQAEPFSQGVIVLKPNQKNRSRAYFRYQRNQVIQRKKKIALHYDWRPKFNGYLAKGKIHCSCSMCSIKTMKNGFPHSQIIQLENLNSQLRDYFIKMDY